MSTAPPTLATPPTVRSPRRDRARPFTAWRTAAVLVLAGVACIGRVAAAAEAPAAVAPPESGPAPAAPAQAAKPEPFALIELYSSEGCSSCPPADDLLGVTAPVAAKPGERALPAAAPAPPADSVFPSGSGGAGSGGSGGSGGGGGGVIALAFHVDYWDHLGWKDPWARPEFSARQRARARAMHRDGVYTPQAVVNGAAEFVGSDKSRMKDEVARALKAAPTVSIEVAAVLDTDPENRGAHAPGGGGSGTDAAPTDKVAAPDQSATPDKPATPHKSSKQAVQPVIDVTVRLWGLKEDATLCVALAQSGLSSKVTRGENAGRTLRHDHVVREFRTVKVSSRDADAVRIALPLPPDCPSEQAEIVVFVEGPASMAVLAAKQIRGVTEGK